MTAVSDQLLAPANAQFNITNVTQPGDGTYLVDGAVDSQNAFGAMVRKRFRCTVTHGTAVVERVA